MRRILRAVRAEGGFTLVELLLVIIILAILAAIVVMSVGTSRDDAVQTVCASRVRSISSSAEAVRVKAGSYPVGTLDSTSSPNPLVAPAAGALLAEWPSEPDFVLRYESTAGASYEVEIFRGDGVTSVASCSDL